MVLYSYRATPPLLKDGHAFTRARMLGMVAEFFWRIAFHDRLGLNACRWQDCTEIPLYDVVINGRHRKEVQGSVPEEDAQLGLHFARLIAYRLLDAGFFILDAIVPVSKQGNRIGDIDLACERRGLPGRSCVECKFRIVLSPAFRPKVWEQVQAESLPLWHAVSTGQTAHVWAERVVVLLEIHDENCTSWTIRAARLLKDKDRWNDVFDWPCEPPAAQDAGPLPAKAPPAAKAAPAPPAAKALPAAKAARPLAAKAPAAAKAAGPVTRKRPLEEILQDQHIEWELVDGVRMASFDSFLTAIDTSEAKKAKNQPGERLAGWSRRFRWVGTYRADSPTLRSNMGRGKAKTMVAESVLPDIYSVV
jgi:hypothetical protein